MALSQSEAEEAEKLRVEQQRLLLLQQQREKAARGALTEEHKRLLRFKSFSFPYLCDVAKWGDHGSNGNGTADGSSSSNERQWQDMDEDVNGGSSSSNQDGETAESFFASFASKDNSKQLDGSLFWSEFLKAQETNIEEML